VEVYLNLRQVLIKNDNMDENVHQLLNELQQKADQEQMAPPKNQKEQLEQERQLVQEKTRKEQEMQQQKQDQLQLEHE
jgi:hypothetical protein